MKATTVEDLDFLNTEVARYSSAYLQVLRPVVELAPGEYGPKQLALHLVLRQLARAAHEHLCSDAGLHTADLDELITQLRKRWEESKRPEGSGVLQ